MAKPRILIAEDHQLVLEGIKRIVEPECVVAGTATTGQEVLSLASELKPDVILLDIALPLLNGIEVARKLKVSCPNTKIIFVTMQLNRDYIREAFEAGGSGYVLKQAAASDLLAAIREVQRGRFYLSPMLSEVNGGTASTEETPARLFGSLTPRQRQVLQLVAEGKPAKEIAGLLTISVKTVEFHKKHLMQQLNVRSTAELIRYAVEHKWVAS
ncbi:MAG: response regulator transcription factor [Acidobacteriaceae bacterium]|nr:response regulator transcription factor [Acidobacteriaceae bacterium]